MADRSRRRCVMRKTALPDATHYVGYVEDDETPEMIMKKFEEMERIKAASKRPAREGSAQLEDSAGPSSAAAAAAGADSDAEQQQQQQQQQQGVPDGGGATAADEDDSPLDQQQLQEIFKATSMYNVKSLLGNNEALMVDATQRLQSDRGGGPASDMGLESDSEDDLVAELRGFWSDDDWSKPSKKKDRGSSKRARGEGSRRGAGRSMQRNARTCIITQYNRDTHAFIRRRVRVADPDAILQLRLPPPPLPLSWGRAIRPYRAPPATTTQQQQQAAAQQATTTPAAAGEGASAAAAGSSAPAAAVPRGLIHQPLALPASRNCEPQVFSSSSGSRDAAGGASSSSSSPSAPPPEASSEVHLTPDLTAFDFKQQLRGQAYQAVLINTGWEAPPPSSQQQQQQQTTGGQQQQDLQQQQQQQQQQEVQEQAGPGPSSLAAAGNAGGVASWGNGSSAHAWHAGSSSSITSRLEQLPLPELCPRGFIMIWGNKEHLSAIFRLMSRWGFSYVENLTWVLLAPNHSILQLPCAFVQRSHITLYIFRKDGEGRDIELRHQRNPDVVFDYVRAVEGREWDVPAEVFDSIETLLPTGKGLFLELWAPTQAGRAGWTHVVEHQSSPPLGEQPTGASE